METVFTKLMNIRHPIVLAPMAGGPSSPALAAAVSNEGGLGFLGGNYLAPTALREEIQRTKQLTTKPFGVNLFVPSYPASPTAKEMQEMLDFTNELRRKLGINPLSDVPPTKDNFAEQVQIILEEKPAAFSFVFGSLSESIIQKFKDHGIKVIGTASSFDEASQLQDAGVDAICLQGFEGGGHRGVFPTNPDQELPLRTLLESILGKIRLPLIAAGGLMTGQDIKDVLNRGASAAQLGTAFLLAKEAGTSKPYREALLSKNKQTEITTAFSGRRARGLVNHYMKEFKAKQKNPLPFPIQNTLTGDIRRKATEMGVSDFISLWAGTHVTEIRPMDAHELMQTLVREMES